MLYLMKLFSLFIIYSFIGWIVEVLVSFPRERRFVNRGFLIGPIVPIWGAGAILITLILKRSDSLISLVFSSAVIASILEYIVNYLMEIIFKARWWDYSHLPFNLNGRIWIGSALMFGIGGLVVLNYGNPFFLNLLGNVNSNVLIVIDLIILIILIIDIFVSCNVISKLKLSAESMRKDYTEEISVKVKNVLSEKSKSFKRILKAFPDVKFNFRIKK